MILNQANNVKKSKRRGNIQGCIMRQFSYRNAEIVLNLYNILVRPHQEYCVQIWSPYLRKDIEILEKVQAKVARLIPSNVKIIMKPD